MTHTETTMDEFKADAAIDMRLRLHTALAKYHGTDGEVGRQIAMAEQDKKAIAAGDTETIKSHSKLFDKVGMKVKLDWKGRTIQELIDACK